MPQSYPYTYTDGQNHRLTFGTALDGHRTPHVSIQAENLTWGGDVANVWLTVPQAHALDRHLADGLPYEWTDHMNDVLTVVIAPDFTTFEVTRVASEDHGDIAVRVVALTGRLPELRKALTTSVEHAEQRAERACGLCDVAKPAYAFRDHMMNVHPDQFEAWRDREQPAVPALTAEPVTEQHPVGSSPVYGALAANWVVPQVDAALRVLMVARQPLASFYGHRCVGKGAYLDPRRDTGQVVLEHCREHAPASGERNLAGERAEDERIVAGWAELFQAQRWMVDRYRETHPKDGYRLVRLVLTPPADRSPAVTPATPQRILTPLEHHAAWHAIEGSAGEEGADPGTVLNAVLRVLNISAPPGE
ncbi:hypothetical protein ACGFR8_31055 [Streptomyces brevispora]|uniref:hypothetical protein n=1 Tax=Streptomyces brevispora TaxID=887462 RepID=UPI00371BD142